jgi:hypothetical protein
MTYLAVFVAGILAAALLWRVLAALLRLVGLAFIALVGMKLVMVADDRLQQPEWMTGAMIGGVVGFVVIGLLCAAFIYHALIAADLRRTIDRDIAQSKARRLW